MPRKTDKLNIRIDPAYKNALQKASELDHRSIANMIEVLIRDHCRKAGIRIEGYSSTIQPQSAKSTRKKTG